MTQMNALKKKTVINVENGKLLGNIKDIYIDDNGRVSYFTVEKKSSPFSSREKRETYSVLWDDISTESDDVILVRAFKEGASEISKKHDGLFASLQGYGAVILLIASVLILLKSCIG